MIGSLKNKKTISSSMDAIEAIAQRRIEERRVKQSDENTGGDDRLMRTPAGQIDAQATVISLRATVQELTAKVEELTKNGSVPREEVESLKQQLFEAEAKIGVQSEPIANFRIRKDLQRRLTDEEKTALKESLKEFGQIHCVLVTKPNKDGVRDVLGGNNRVEQMLDLGVEFVRFEEYKGDAADHQAVAAISNIVQPRLTTFELARHYQMLKDQYDFREAEIGKMASMSQSAVNKTLSVLKMPLEIQKVFDQPGRRISLSNVEIMQAAIKAIAPEHHQVLAACFEEHWSDRAALMRAVTALQKKLSSNESKINNEQSYSFGPDDNPTVVFKISKKTATLKFTDEEKMKPLIEKINELLRSSVE